MRRVFVHKGRALLPLVVLAAALSTTLVSPLSPAHADAAGGFSTATVPSPPLPAATVAGFSGTYGDSAPYTGDFVASAISADGNTIVYASTSYQPNETHSVVLNRRTGQSISLPTSRAYLNEDGSRAVYLTECGGSCSQLYVRDLTTGVETRLDVPDGQKQSWIGELSFDGGRTVVFKSRLPQVPGAGTLNWYVRDLVTGVTRLLKDPLAPVNGAPSVAYGSAVSPGGRFIVFTWLDGSKSWVSVHDQVTGTYTRVASLFGWEQNPIGGISNSGKMTLVTQDALIPEDTDTFPDVYVLDLVSGTVTRGAGAGLPDTGAATGATISANGRYVLYSQWGGSPSPVLVFWNLATGARRVLTGMDGRASSVTAPVTGSVLSRDGRYLLTNGETEANRWGVVLRDQAQDCAGDFVTGSSSGSEPLYGSPFDDVLYGSPGPDTVYGAGGNDVICGLGGDDVIDGGPGDDALYGGAGDDRIEGNEGNDVVLGSVGADSMNGGVGTDALLYLDATAGVDVSLSRVTPNGMPGEGDRVFNDFEWIYGTAYDDTLSGRENGEKLVSMAGDDLLLAMDGNDELWGGDGKDTLVGMAGNDYLNGGFGPSDSCAGGTGTNTFADCASTSNIS
ncbi:hypothetical protein Psi02_66870 [Planotetraspora silvatica]|uniref:Calcium-binding protein n=2 Tax=Planotetraspora silvatica TaxID=234614 RepID=A0A8J3UQK7_9ACTN|nr:hypothetical protein Psi02_66870 [Planotetraspora silvatica]